MKFFIETHNQFKEYKEYYLYMVKSKLKAGVSGSYLGYLWWVLDPLMFMLVYVFVVGVIFDRGTPDFPIFVFCGLLPWKWTSTTISKTPSCIKSNKGVLRQVYIPKFILPLIDVTVTSVHYIFGLTMLFALLPIFDISLSVHVFEFIFVFITQFAFLFGVSLILSHLGVFISDMSNILSFTIRFWFYCSPILYDVSGVPQKYVNIFYINPMVTFFESYRNVFMFGRAPNYEMLLVWSGISMVLIYVGLVLFKENDTNYTKVI